ncbi:hypothetical protein NPIL_417281 [Nephila pilipes]|uniref:Uncharacterized protein n=1 Tax=Nephila pilipes TaxID=299642 RepID=A0A8X6K0J6_NEPPI|nr:hypothetical protein NPIL_417281 [Nephila pilipes]
MNAKVFRQVALSQNVLSVKSFYPFIPYTLNRKVEQDESLGDFVQLCQKALFHRQKIAESGNPPRRYVAGRGRSTAPRHDAYVSLIATGNKYRITDKITSELATATATHAFAKTISQQLNQADLYAQKPAKCI